MDGWTYVSIVVYTEPVSDSSVSVDHASCRVLSFIMQVSRRVHAHALRTKYEDLSLPVCACVVIYQTTVQ